MDALCTPAKWDQPRPPPSLRTSAHTGVAIRIFAAPPGPGGATRRRGYGLPRPDGLAMTAVVGGEAVCVYLCKPRDLVGGATPPALQNEFHTPSVSQRPVERAQWFHLTTGLPERIGSRPCRATGRAVSACLAARTTYQARIAPRHCRATGREVLLDYHQAKPISPEFAPDQARYAERKIATSREGPMVSFDHRPSGTNWLPALSGRRIAQNL